MIREYVENHQWNRTVKEKAPTGGGSLYFVRGVIKCDGTEHCFVGWDANQKKAQEQFDSFKNSECTCIPHSQVGCPIHPQAYQGKSVVPGESIEVKFDE